MQSTIPNLFCSALMLLASPPNSSLTAPLRGLQILDASRIAVLLGESIQVLGMAGNGHAEPSIELGMKLERGAPLIAQEKNPKKFERYCK